jgi:hypothetical protein
MSNLCSFNKCVVSTAVGNYAVVEIHVPMLCTYVLVHLLETNPSTLPFVLPKDLKVGEHTSVIDDYTLSDYYVLGNIDSYIEILEITLGLREAE